MKTKIFNEVLKIVSEVTEISEEVILSKAREAEVVDARAILAEVLRQKGFYPNTIAELMHTSSRNVVMIHNNYADRLNNSVMMQINYSYIKKMCFS